MANNSNTRQSGPGAFSSQNTGQTHPENTPPGSRQPQSSENPDPLSDTTNKSRHSGPSTGNTAGDSLVRGPNPSPLTSFSGNTASGARSQVTNRPLGRLPSAGFDSTISTTAKLEMEEANHPGLDRVEALRRFTLFWYKSSARYIDEEPSSKCPPGLTVGSIKRTGELGKGSKKSIEPLSPKTLQDLMNKAGTFKDSATPQDFEVLGCMIGDKNHPDPDYDPQTEAWRLGSFIEAVLMDGEKAAWDGVCPRFTNWRFLE